MQRERAGLVPIGEVVSGLRDWSRVRLGAGVIQPRSRRKISCLRHYRQGQGREDTRGDRGRVNESSFNAGWPAGSRKLGPGPSGKNLDPASDVPGKGIP